MGGYKSSVSSIVSFSVFLSFSPLQGYESDTTYAVSEYESPVWRCSFSLFFFTPLFKVMSLIYTVDEYESSVCSIVHFVFLAFPLSKVMSLI